MNDSAKGLLAHIVGQLLDCPAEQRQARLDDLSGGDPALAEQVRQRLRELEAGDEGDRAPSSAPMFKPKTVGGERAEVSAEATTAAPSAVAGQRIAHYRIRREIARGAMGVVYEAVQEHPHRVVALKVLKPGLASRSALHRFQYESQILARLRHPNIAQVYEAGTHVDPSTPASDPLPFFAMEYVPNARSLLDYAEHKRLDTNQRLLLFAKVCAAVHHGHQKGIIHRDLKPGNILVDSAGEPKIIDFGVARAVDSDMALTTMQTSFGQIIGTLPYMSPEQCDADPQDLDTRSDVYALGVVLYELICGQLPYDLTAAGVAEAIRVIREQSPARPSTIKRRLRGDVETITMKALAKERERRYQTASELASDIEHYLNNEPILARRPSVLYQFRKFARRRQGLVAVLGFALFMLVVAAVMTGLYARGQARQAELLRRESEGLRHLLSFLDAILVAPGSFEMGQDAQVLDVVDSAAGVLDRGLIQNRVIEATFRTAIGKTYLEINRLDEAEHHLETARLILDKEVGPDDARYADTLFELAWLRHQQYDEAARSMTEDCLRTYRDALGDDHERTAEALQQLGIILFENGDLAAGERQLRAALQTYGRLPRADKLRVAETKLELGRVLMTQGELAAAEKMVREANALLRLLRGNDHAHVSLAEVTLAKVLRQAERWDEAGLSAREALRIGRLVYEPDDQALMPILNELGLFLMHKGAYDEAASAFNEALKIGDDVGILLSLAMLLDEKDDSHAAAKKFVEVLGIYENTMEPDHWFIANARSHYGKCLTNLKRYDEAEAELLKAYHGLADAGVTNRANKAASRLADLYHLIGRGPKGDEWDLIASTDD